MGRPTGLRTTGIVWNMTRRVAAIAVLLAVVTNACSRGTSTTARSSDAPATIGASESSDLAGIQSQIATASSDVCPIISAADVAVIFGETTPLTTQAMSEKNGPACGFPHPRQGGYVLVLQFQSPSRWKEYAESGQQVVGLGREAQLVSSSTLFVRDEKRNVVLMILAPDGDASGKLLRIASRIYGTSPDNVLARP